MRTVPPLTAADIDRRRGRLLGYLALLLASFAGFSVAVTLLDPSLLSVLHVTPAAARFGVLALTVGLVALVFERERALRRLAEESERQRFLVASFRNRLAVLESLVEAHDRLNAPLTVPDVLEVLLDTAIELSGAEGGTVSAASDAEEEEGEVVIARRHSVSVPPGRVPAGEVLELPLETDGRKLGTLTLSRPFPDDDALTESILRQFAERAARALDRAQLVAHERASVAYLRAANLVKSRFLQTVSHELRTPLTSIMGYARTLERHWYKLDDDAKLEFTRAVAKQGSKLKMLVERILDAAKVELEGVTVRRVDHDVRRSIARALDRFESETERINLAVPAHAVEAYVDPFVVEQAVVNLVDNALRYTKGAVSVSLDGYRSSLVMTVRDEGPGMDPQQLEHVTRPLYRLDDVRSGTGLGLHIVQTLVADHQGTLSIRSDNSGTVVQVSLPRTALRPKETASAI